MTERQEKVLIAMLRHARTCESWENTSLTGNQIGVAVGFGPGGSVTFADAEEIKGAARGRSMGPAQRVISTLNGLKQRGLVRYGARRDARVGTAYCLTDAGVRAAMHLLGEDPDAVEAAS